MRSQSPATLALLDQQLQCAIAEIAVRQGVQILLGEQTGSDAGVICPPLAEQLRQSAAALGHSSLDLPSGAGHDAALFAGAGVATAMLFVRNANGSHNPDEAMAAQDFDAATEVLAQVLRQRAER